MRFKNSQQRKAIFARLRERDKVYKQYKKTTNVSYKMLLNWSKNPCSREASLSREPVNRNLRLLKKPKSEWDKRDIEGAKRTILFIKRHRGQPKGKPRSEGCPSGRTIALKNWAYFP